MPITASSGALTYLKGGSSYGSYDWWVSTNSAGYFLSLQYLNGKFYSTFEFHAYSNVDDSTLLESIPDDNSIEWSNRNVYSTLISTLTDANLSTVAVDPIQNRILQFGFGTLPPTSGGIADYWSFPGLYNLDGSVIQEFTWPPQVVANVSDLRQANLPFYKNGYFYSLGAVNIGSIIRSGTYYPINALFFAKYADSTTNITPTIYREITYGADTYQFGISDSNLSANQNLIVAGSAYKASQFPGGAYTPYVFSTGDLTTNWSKSFSFVNMGTTPTVSAIATDSNNNVYLILNGSLNRMVVKLDSSGNVLWSNSVPISIEMTGISADDTGCYVTATNYIFKLDDSGNLIYVNNLTNITPGSTEKVFWRKSFIIGGAIYIVGNIGTSNNNTNTVGAIWKIPKDGSIPGDGTYVIGSQTFTYAPTTGSSSLTSLTVSNFPLFESSPSPGTISQDSYTINNTISPNTFVPLT